MINESGSTDMDDIEEEKRSWKEMGRFPSYETLSKKNLHTATAKLFSNNKGHRKRCTSGSGRGRAEKQR